MDSIANFTGFRQAAKRTRIFFSFQTGCAIFEKQKEEVLQEMENLQKVLSMLNYKCWYYDQAIEKNDEAYVQALSFNQFPPQIQQYYKHSHEDC